VLNLLAAHNQTLYTYNIGSSSYDITLLKFLIGILIIVFVGMEQSPSSKNKQFPKTWHTIGGLISGFFGGLSGNQGALRTMFLIKSDIPKEAFLATGIAIACLVDITRLTTYFTQPERLAHVHANLNTVGFATLFAFFGAYLGSRLFHKITLASIQKVVMVSLLLIAVLLIFGII
jgi:uncharacterized membrane protein YfcA